MEKCYGCGKESKEPRNARSMAVCVKLPVKTAYAMVSFVKDLESEAPAELCPDCTWKILGKENAS